MLIGYENCEFVSTHVLVRYVLTIHEQIFADYLTCSVKLVLMTNEQIIKSLNQIVFNYRFAIRQPKKMNVVSLDSLSYILGFLKLNNLEIKSAETMNLDSMLPHQKTNDEINKMKSDLKKLQDDKTKLVRAARYEKVALMRDVERKLIETMNIKTLKLNYEHSGPFYLLGGKFMIYLLDPDDELYQPLKNAIFQTKQF